MSSGRFCVFSEQPGFSLLRLLSVAIRRPFSSKGYAASVFRFLFSPCWSSLFLIFSSERSTAFVFARTARFSRVGINPNFSCLVLVSQLAGIAFSAMAMAAVAPAQASGSIALCQVVRQPRALKDARVTKMNALSSSMNGASRALVPDPAYRKKSSGSHSQVRCTLAEDVHTRDRDDVRTYKGFERPDSFGRYGVYGGKYVPETLMAALTNLEVAYRATIKDPEFQVGTFFLLSVFNFSSCFSPLQ